MAFFNEFPHTRTYDSELGWLIWAMKKLISDWENFSNTNSIKFADPINWTIDRNYEPSMIVLDSDGNGFISRKPVPAGVPLNNEDYWTQIFSFGDITNTIRENIAYNAEESATAPIALQKDQLVWWNDDLYIVLYDIAPGTAFITGTNVQRMTVDEKINNITDGIGDALETEREERIAADDTEREERIAADDAEQEAREEEFNKREAYVTYRQFGALLDGVTDDSAAVIAAHDYANLHGYRVEEHTGSLKLNFTVDVKTDCDFSGMIFIMDDDTPTECYRIVHDAEEIPSLIMTLEDDSDTYDRSLWGKFMVPRLADSQTDLGERDSGTITHYYHRQPLALDRLGTRLTAPYFLDTVTGNFELWGFSEITEHAVTFRGGSVDVNSENYRGFHQFVACSRNNTVIENITVNYSRAPLNVSTDLSRGMIYVNFCCNVSIRNINGFNHSVDISQSSPYMLTIENCWHVSVRDCLLTQGWGAIATHYCDDLLFDNLVCNRVDNHYGIFGDMSVQNCRFNGSPARINFGYGRGTIRVDNCTGYESTLLYGRHDFNISFDGNIYVSNCSSDNINSQILQVAEYTGPSAEPTNFNKKEVYVFVSNMTTYNVLGNTKESYTYNINMNGLMIRKSTIVPYQTTAHVRVRMNNCSCISNANILNAMPGVYIVGCVFGNSTTITASQVRLIACSLIGSSGVTRDLTFTDSNGGAGGTLIGCYFFRAWNVIGASNVVANSFGQHAVSVENSTLANNNTNIVAV